MRKKKKMSQLEVNMKSFMSDLRRLQKKYPMVYIEAWTPDDFVFSTYDDDDAELTAQPSCEWKNPEHVAVAQRLAHKFDANEGTNWERLREILSSI